MLHIPVRHGRTCSFKTHMLEMMCTCLYVHMGIHAVAWNPQTLKSKVRVAHGIDSCGGTTHIRIMQCTTMVLAELSIYRSAQTLPSNTNMTPMTTAAQMTSTHDPRNIKYLTLYYDPRAPTAKLAITSDLLQSRIVRPGEQLLNRKSQHECVHGDHN